MWTLQEFVRRIQRCGSRYQAENAWFHHWGNELSYVLCAWRIYRCAGEAPLGFLLLGDTKIRKDPVLVMNFGLASTSGVQDAEERKMVEGLMVHRAGLAGGAAADVVGPGVILSDAAWTPLLNDAFLLGGIHRGCDFHLAEEGFGQFAVLGEREFLARRQVFGAPSPQYAQALARGPDYYRARWRDYLRQHRDVLWRDGVPRVFVRELLGLAHFGYAPRFTSSELGFACEDVAAAGAASFVQYLDGLAAVQYQNNREDVILPAVARFLFGDPAALN